jgi:hypothetical protein
MIMAAIIDAAVHPLVRGADDLRAYMPEPWRSRPFPGPQRYVFPTPTGVEPFGQWVEEAYPPVGLPASDPEALALRMDQAGVQTSILLPQTRGLLPDVDMGSYVCSATNNWLTSEWLTGEHAHRFRGPAIPEWFRSQFRSRPISPTVNAPISSFGKQLPKPDCRSR